jgi:hypothetical protein
LCGHRSFFLCTFDVFDCTDNATASGSSSSGLLYYNTIITSCVAKRKSKIDSLLNVLRLAQLRAELIR